MQIIALPEHRHDEAIALWHACGLTRPWNDPRHDLERALAGASSTILAIEAEDRLVGTAMVGHDGHRAWVYYVAVDPALRHQGLGRALMAACEQWALDQGMPKLQFMVRTDNTPVLDFYSQLGYELQDCVVLGRRLQLPNTD